MLGFVSGRPYSVWALAAALVVVFVAYSILIPYGFPWLGLGWVGFALVAALGVRRMRSARSLHQIARDINAEPAPAQAASIPQEVR
jgi:membrane protein implicated in regulation of membrane protease activity